jgi:predicted flap endonuclease-1-like 5' DNA nuclease
MATAKFNAFVAAGADNKLQVDAKVSTVRCRRVPKFAMPCVHTAGARTPLTPRALRPQVPGIGPSMESKLEARGIKKARTRAHTHATMRCGESNFGFFS